MLNSLIISGLVLFGSIDKVNENFATVEYTVYGKIQYLDIPLEDAPCKPVEGMYVLFSNKTIVKCLLFTKK